MSIGSVGHTHSQVSARQHPSIPPAEHRPTGWAFRRPQRETREGVRSGADWRSGGDVRLCCGGGNKSLSLKSS